MSVIGNRLEKNDKKIRPWAERKGYEAYRLYDLDIPEYPFILDRYGEFLLFYDRSDERIERDKLHIQESIRAIQDSYRPKPGQLILKSRERQKGSSQYQKLASKKNFFIVREGELRFEVNLHDYLDTGLFLDHRPLRERLLKEAKGRVLNLFCYTGALSVAAAKAGAEVTSIDLSQTYLEWAQRNFRENGLDPSLHRFFRQDLMQYLAGPARDLYDLILLDPPTFSNSKKMKESFEVERDQDFLVDNCMKRLKPEGLLIFSNNKRKFRLSESISNRYVAKDITENTIPFDFHNQSIHRCFEVRHKKS
jgi:23S rRNA (cytosine1962-C5)-methyltransferase/23S rRNA (guanine2445-N2)-methyltransferase / 23S rRNA (guanine2069-N7)-methyltransferase